MRNLIIGLSCFFHDSAIAVVNDGIPVFCLQEERISRSKGDRRFPELALREAIRYLDIKPAEVAHVVFYEDPVNKYNRIREFSPSSEVSENASRLLQTEHILVECINTVFGCHVVDNVIIGRHHLSHACSSLMVSPFINDKCHILCLDAVGEWDTSTYWRYQKPSILDQIASSQYPDSLGLFYSAITHYLGFKVNSGEYKVMGLAPYGNPLYVDDILSTIIKPENTINGSNFPFNIGQDY
ncbi:MAG: hypothetical protein EB127_32105, partial [Alphaproteobacteria bacterium]|nr:hypothetical protein [Alphaproteobacteria bacterium]